MNRYFDRLKKLEVNIVTIFDDRYRDSLPKLNGKLPLLYVKAKIGLLNSTSITIPGQADPPLFEIAYFSIKNGARLTTSIDDILEDVIANSF